MTEMSVPYNIQNHAGALAEGLSRGDRIHVAVRGPLRLKDASFFGFMSELAGIVITFPRGYSVMNLLWSDIVELWLIDEKPDPYYSDVPEVAEKLEELKMAVHKCVQTNDGGGVLNLLDRVVEVKKAERFFKEAREIVADTDKWLRLTKD